MTSPVEIFCCYARKDLSFLQDLIEHLASLQRQQRIKIWADIDIGAGTEWEKEIEKHLNTAQIILLLVSPKFIASDYCYGIEMKRAIERHERGEARVIPIILRPVDWQETPFGKLQALPPNAKPVTSWPDQDEAFFDVAQGIKKVVMEIEEKSKVAQQQITERTIPEKISHAQGKQQATTTAGIPSTGKGDAVEKGQGRGDEIEKIIGGGELKGTTVTGELTGKQTSGELQGTQTTGELEVTQTSGELKGRQISDELTGKIFKEGEDRFKEVQALYNTFSMPEAVKYQHWIDVNHKQAQQANNIIPLELAQQWYKERPELQQLVQNVAEATKGGHALIELNQGEADNAYQKKVVQAIKDRYIYSGYYDARPDAINQQIRQSVALGNRVHQTIIALEGEEIRLQQEIHAQKREAYTPPAIYPKKYWQGWKTSPPDPTL